MLGKKLIAMLRCPRCRGGVQEVSTAEGVESPESIECPRCHLLFAVVDGIPNMLIDEARPAPPATAPGPK